MRQKLLLQYQKHMGPTHTLTVQEDKKKTYNPYKTSNDLWDKMLAY